MKQPTCIHAPHLLGGQPSPVLWGEVEGAEGYWVERKLRPVPGSIPEKWFGFTWQEIHGNQHDFGQIHSTNSSWQKMAALGSKRPIEDCDSFALVFTGLGESADYTHPGVSWSKIHAAALTMEDMGEKGYNWQETADLSHAAPHRQCMDTLPTQVENAVYRVKAYGGGVESAYFESPPFPVQHFTPANDALAVEVSPANPLLVGIGADLARRFPLGLTVSYDAGTLEFLGMEGEAVALTAQESGRISLHFTGEYPDKMYSGYLGLLRFGPLATGETTLQLD